MSKGTLGYTHPLSTRYEGGGEVVASNNVHNLQYFVAKKLMMMMMIGTNTRKMQKAGDNFIVMSFISCAFHQILLW
jgi:hypothetical protein